MKNLFILLTVLTTVLTLNAKDFEFRTVLLTNTNQNESEESFKTNYLGQFALIYNHEISTNLQFKSFVARRSNLNGENTNLNAFFLNYKKDKFWINFGKCASLPTSYRPFPATAASLFESMATSYLPGGANMALVTGYSHFAVSIASRENVLRKKKNLEYAFRFNYKTYSFTIFKSDKPIHPEEERNLGYVHEIKTKKFYLIHFNRQGFKTLFTSFDFYNGLNIALDETWGNEPWHNQFQEILFYKENSYLEKHLFITFGAGYRIEDKKESVNIYLMFETIL